MAFIRIEVDDDFINQLAEAVAKANLRAGGVLPGTDTHPASQNGSQGHESPAEDDSVASDPWANPANQNGNGGGPTASQPPVVPPTSGTINVNTPKGPRTVTFGKYGAPPCMHGQPAAFVEWTKPDGNKGKRWTCAAGFTQRWKDKCDFNQWA